jgi:hypothetical protein
VRGVCPDCGGDAPDDLTVEAGADVLFTVLRFVVRRALPCAARAPAIGQADRNPRSISRLALGLLLEAAAAEKTDDNAGADPIVGLMRVGTERSAVVVGVEQTDFDVAGRMDVQAAAHFERNAVH